MFSLLFVCIVIIHNSNIHNSNNSQQKFNLSVSRYFQLKYWGTLIILVPSESQFWRGHCQNTCSYWGNKLLQSLFTIQPRVGELHSTVVSQLSVSDKMWPSDYKIYSVVDEPWTKERCYLLPNWAEKPWPLHIRDQTHLSRCKENLFKFLNVKRKTLPNISQVLGLGSILWYNTNSEKEIWDVGTRNMSDCSGSG